MSLFSDNIRYLRIKNGYSQEKVAQDLSIQRARYRKYDDGTSEPPYELLKKISAYYGLSIDLLLCVDIRKIKTQELLKLDNNRILFPITVDRQGNNMVEIVTQKAKAGYLTGYADPEYIESLLQFYFPLLGPGHHRVFPIEGDSMPPHADGAFIISRYIESLREVKDGKTYIIISRDEGIVYKRVTRKGEDTLLLVSDNPLYEPYELHAGDVLEIWEFEYYLGKKDLKASLPHGNDIGAMFEELKREIRQLASK